MLATNISPGIMIHHSRLSNPNQDADISNHTSESDTWCHHESVEWDFMVLIQQKTSWECIINSTKSSWCTSLLPKSEWKCVILAYQILMLYNTSATSTKWCLCQAKLQQSSHQLQIWRPNLRSSNLRSKSGIQSLIDDYHHIHDNELCSP